MACCTQEQLKVEDYITGRRAEADGDYAAAYRKYSSASGFYDAAERKKNCDSLR